MQNLNCTAQISKISQPKNILDKLILRLVLLCNAPSNLIRNNFLRRNIFLDNFCSLAESLKSLGRAHFHRSLPFKLKKALFSILPPHMNNLLSLLHLTLDLTCLYIFHKFNCTNICHWCCNQSLYKILDFQMSIPQKNTSNSTHCSYSAFWIAFFLPFRTSILLSFGCILLHNPQHIEQQIESCPSSSRIPSPFSAYMQPSTFLGLADKSYHIILYLLFSSFLVYSHHAIKVIKPVTQDVSIQPKP